MSINSINKINEENCMLKKLLPAVLLFFFLHGFAIAQNATISGVISDAETGDELPGASVFIPDLQIGAATNVNGQYSIEQVPFGTYVIRVTYVGYRTINQTVEVNETSMELDFSLQPDFFGLDQVVVVGYGVQQRSDLTGAVATVSSEDIQNQPVASLDAAIQGRASGVLVTSPSGTPGAGINIQIRGNSSLSGNSSPLYVIDGVPVVAEDLSGLFSGGQATNTMADLNPNDIESIEILKDASATAIYGSRGANGVVLITTKRGRAGQTNIQFNGYRGFQNVTNKIDMMSSQEFLQLMDEAALNDDADLGTNYGPGYVSGIWGFDPNDPDLQNTRWYDEIFRTAEVRNYELSASGGNEQTRFFTSLSYFDQEGVQYGTGFERLSARLNLDTEINSWLDVGSNITLNRTVQDRAINDNSLYGVVINTLAADPLMPVFEEDGSYADPFAYFGWWMLDNPLLIANEYYRFTRTVRGIGSIFGNAQIADGLSLRSSASVDFLSLGDEAYTPIISRESRNAGRNGFGTYGTTQDITWIIENYLTYTNTFADVHNFTGVLGTSFQSSERDFSSINAQGYPSDQFVKTSVAAQVTGASTSGTRWGLASYFARVNYSFDNRYLFTFTSRLDGSSRFGENFRYGFFPSGSVAWRITEESFMQGQSIFSELKPRVSYGFTGNQDGIGNFSSRGLFGVSDYRSTPSLVPVQMSNSNLTWESTEQLDIGLDVGLFEDRVTFTADYFIKRTENLLQNRLIPGISGFSSVTENIGEVENRGFEFSARGVILNGPLRWSSSFNISFIRNEVTRLEVDRQVISDSHILAEGHPIGTFYLIRSDGVDPETGNIIWFDKNEDGVINSADRVIVGNAQPDFFGGFGNRLSYRGFDLDFLFQFVYGNKIFNHSRASYENLGFSRLNPNSFPLPDGNNHSYASNRWQQPGDETDIPRASLSNVNWREYSSRWLEDGSYLRLKSLNFGYTVPRSVVNSIGVQSLRLYIQGQNLLTFTNYTGFDPEVNQNARDGALAGRDFGTLPQVRTFSVGVNLQL